MLSRKVVREVKLTDKAGLVHLRYALVFDADFTWNQRHTEPLNGDDWAYALRFAKGDEKVLVLFSRTFDRLGRVAEGATGDIVDVLPCPRLGPVILQYLGEVGVKLGEAAPAPTADESR